MCDCVLSSPLLWEFAWSERGRLYSLEISLVIEISMKYLSGVRICSLMESYVV